MVLWYKRQAEQLRKGYTSDTNLVNIDTIYSAVCFDGGEKEIRIVVKAATTPPLS